MYVHMKNDNLYILPNALLSQVLIQGATSPVIPGWTLALDIIPTAMCFLR
jgi:hypothetical protein